ncbi:TetR/AcrR family transcriptional regulator [Dawidia soli]|uniref:TetR/AcrR family transcriptional regulator n=1 Tax=Dawidia soli TaxID=2782352 RepID=A0AAP2DF47_9BACT|nr:TetR family transcriptional regulator C-terminal domain-containing protein [Dawidia soli]MBT1690609.1 TetR/AcrR family transcriptional regulator [Dawidia soli]
MDTAKKTSSRKSAAKQPQPDKIMAAYKAHLLTHGHQPPSVYKFCLDAGIAEDEFYQYFGSFEALERAVWKWFIDQTVNRLQADDSFNNFNTRERVLAFYFTLLETLRSERSLVLLYLNGSKRLEITPAYLRSFRASFDAFFTTLLAEGKQRGDVATRPYLEKQYPNLFWLHLGFILTFWKQDDSAGFERTDAAVEKSVNLAFDLVGTGALDSALDFGKFLYQQHKF